MNGPERDAHAHPHVLWVAQGAGLWGAHGHVVVQTHDGRITRHDSWAAAFAAHGRDPRTDPKVGDIVRTTMGDERTVIDFEMGDIWVVSVEHAGAPDDHAWSETAEEWVTACEGGTIVHRTVTP